MPSPRKPAGARPRTEKRAAKPSVKKAARARTPAARPSAAAAEIREPATPAAGAAASGRRTRASRAPGATIAIQQYRSGIGCIERQKRTLKALGLRRPRQTVVRPDNPAVRGMVQSIPHLVRIVEGS